MTDENDFPLCVCGHSSYTHVVTPDDVYACQTDLCGCENYRTPPKGY